MSQPENLPNKLAEVVEKPISNSSKSDFQPVKGMTNERKFQSCNVEEGILGDTSSIPLEATEVNNVHIENRIGVKMREKKKSKYLLYPYVDSMYIPDEGNKETKEVPNVHDSGKPCCGLNEHDKERVARLTSEELLCELRLYAQNCSYIMDGKHFAPSKKFYSGLRRFTFMKHDDDSSHDLSETQSVINQFAKESSTGIVKRGDEDKIEHPSSSGKLKQLGRIADKNSRDTDFSCMLNNCPDGLVESARQCTVSSIAEAKQMKSGYGVMEVGRLETLYDASKIQKANQHQKCKTVSDITEANLLNGLPDLNENIFNISEVTGATLGTQFETKAIQVKHASLVKSSLDLQSSPPGFTPHHRGEMWQNSIAGELPPVTEFAVSTPVMIENVAKSSSIREYKHKSSLGYVPRSESSRQKRNEEALNIRNNETDVSIQNMNGVESVFPEITLVKRRKSSSDSKAYDIVQQLGAIILNFNTGFLLPSVESILQVFAGYGMIFKPETRFINDVTAQVVFVQRDCAKKAFQSLPEKNPFGQLLRSYHLTPLSVAKTNKGMSTPPGMISQQSMNRLNGLPPPPGFLQHGLNGLPPPPGFPPHAMNRPASPGFPPPAMNQLNGLTAPPGFPQHTMSQFNGLPTPPVMVPNNEEPSNLMFIKKNLEEMSSMMEKKGSILSPEMRGKLECEIRCLKHKVNLQIGASS